MAVDLQTHTAAVKLPRASAEHSGHPHNQMEMSKFTKIIYSLLHFKLAFIIKFRCPY